MRQLPPTPTLRAFEAAARHKTFSAAAAELNVTQSAISHQILHLEALWTLKLFERGKSLRLTVAGAALAPIIRQFVVSLDGMLDTLEGQSRRTPFRVSVTQSFASRWLLPRVPDFEAAHPDLQLCLETALHPIAFGDGEADVAVRLGSGPYPGFFAEQLMREYIFPVASPDLIARFGKPDTAADLLRFPLIFRGGPEIVPKWEFWFARAGVEVVLPHTSTLYPDTNMTIEAALAGHGVALVRSGHVETELREARLVRLLQVRFPSPLAYHFVCPRGREGVPALVAFREWIGKQAQAAQVRYDTAQL